MDRPPRRPEAQVEEEDEPILKYQRMNNLEDVLNQTKITCVLILDKVLILGTEAGQIFLCTLEGKQRAKLRAHDKKVTSLAADAQQRYLASCSLDGTVVITSTDPAKAKTKEETYHIQQRLLSLALQPDFGIKKCLIAGDIAGNVTMFSQLKWLEKRTEPLEQGEGPVQPIVWKGDYVAWADNMGVRIYEPGTKTKVCLYPRRKDIQDLNGKGCRPFLTWETETSLLIGWGDSVTHINVVRIPQPGDSKEVPRTRAFGQVLSFWQTDCIICGISPFDQDTLCLLGYPLDFEPGDDEAEFESEPTTPVLQECSPGKRPEVHIVSRKDGEILFADALPLRNYQKQSAWDYTLQTSYTDSCRTRALHALWHRDLILGKNSKLFVGSIRGLPPCIFIMSPMEVVLAVVRDVDDKVEFALAHSNWTRAIEIGYANRGILRRHMLQEIVGRYLEHLMEQGRWELAASECARLIGEDSETGVWERWIYAFAKEQQLAAIAPHIPINHSPPLPAQIFEFILEHFLVNNPKSFVDAIKRWGNPKKQQGYSLYNMDKMMSKLEAVLRRHPDPSLLEGQAELFVMDGQHERALISYLEVDHGEGRSGASVPSGDYSHVFQLIEDHDLFLAIRNKVLKLIRLDKALAGSLLARHLDRLPVADVFAQLRSRKDLQHWYLHLLFTRAPEVYNTQDYARFHLLQVSLYAEFAPDFVPGRGSDSTEGYDSDLLRFLRGSSFVTLEVALAECERKRPNPLYDEMVYILGRMGDTRRALSLLLHHVHSVDRAIQFLESHDKDLWYQLIDYSLQHEEFLTGLLEHAGRYNVDLAGLVKKIPEGMRVDGLRDKLVKIISDFHFQVSLHEGSSKILQTDTLDLMRRFNQGQRRALHYRPEQLTGESSSSTHHEKASGQHMRIRRSGLKCSAPSCSKMLQAFKTGRRGSLSNKYNNDFDNQGPPDPRNGIIFFGCRHGYHVKCLLQGTIESGEAQTKPVNNDSVGGLSFDQNDEYESFDKSSLQCILCSGSKHFGRSGRR